MIKMYICVWNKNEEVKNMNEGIYAKKNIFGSSKSFKTRAARKTWYIKFQFEGFELRLIYNFVTFCNINFLNFKKNEFIEYLNDL